MTTITTTTITATAATGITTSLGVIASLELLVFLVAKQLAVSITGAGGRWAHTLNLGIVPLLFAFALIAAIKVVALR